MTPPDTPARVTLTAVLEPRSPAAAVILDDAALEAIGAGRKTPPVLVTVTGHTFRGRIGRMRGETMLGFSKAVREACGVQAGDEIALEIVLDEAPREVDVPPALAAALDADPDARRMFDAMAYTHRKEYARWIVEAKREETRERRIAKAVEMIREGRGLS